MVGSLLFILPLIVIAAIGFLIIMHFSQKEKSNLNFNSLLLAYCYVISLISLIAVVVGTAALGSALLSDVFGRDFSYQSNNYYYAEEKFAEEVESTEAAVIKARSMEEMQLQEKENISQRYQEDILNGSSVLVVGLLFLVAHIAGWRTLEKRGQHPNFLYRAYIFSQLAIYSLATLIALPTATSQLLRFLTQEAPTPGYGSLPAPGMAVMIAILVLPLWAFFTITTIKLANKSHQ